MNRKFQDVKINTKPLKKVPTPDVKIKEKPSESFLHENIKNNKKEENKYQFLNKINKKTPDYTKISQYPQLPKQKTSINKKILFLFIVSLIIGVVYLLSTVFLRAKVTIIAKNQNFDLKHQKFTASKESNSPIPFEIMIVSDSEFKDVVLTSSMEANEKAKGEILLYNEFSNLPQKITAGTFVSDEKGRTYKTDSSITIPGYTLKEKVVIPGQASVGITSFLAGDAYNGSPEYFYINNFKNTAKYKKIYGKIKIPLTGGATGLVYKLDEKEKDSILFKNSDLKEKLLRKLSAQVPDGYILYSEAVNFSNEFVGNYFYKTSEAKVEMKGSLSAVLIKEKDLSDVIIKKLLPGISTKEKNQILEPKMSNLSFNFTNIEQVIDKDMESFDFELSGNLLINWMPYLDEIKSLLVNKNRNDVSSIFEQDKGILSAEVKIIPFWSKVLPDNIKNINIILK